MTSTARPTVQPIYRIPADRRRAALEARLYLDDLNRAEGQWALSRRVTATYNLVRGDGVERTVRGRIVGVSQDATYRGDVLVLVDDATGQLVSIPLPVLVGVEPRGK